MNKHFLCEIITHIKKLNSTGTVTLLTRMSEVNEATTASNILNDILITKREAAEICQTRNLFRYLFQIKCQK